jgi:hypothetical protein
MMALKFSILSQNNCHGFVLFFLQSVELKRWLANCISTPEFTLWRTDWSAFGENWRATPFSYHRLGYPSKVWKVYPKLIHSKLLA